MKNNTNKISQKLEKNLFIIFFVCISLIIIIDYITM